MDEPRDPHGSQPPATESFDEDDRASRSPAWTGAMRAMAPAFDPLQMDVARAKAERELFGSSEPPRLGRFVLLGQIAMGGMGVVYGGYDPQLDRRVALKLLHPEAPRSTVRHERLLAEARALAKLDHPNVVPVHDVVVVEDQVVVVMEWVEGKTLANWEHEQPRRWAEIVEVYQGAGRGLQAAHALGLIHRDFKPANALIGDDGRVRILDFGLARLDRAGRDESRSPSRGGDDAHGLEEPRGDAPPDGWSIRDRAAVGLTASGEVLGTLAFMAPEQLAGELATEASDQFSFCVALFRALYGAAPYAGSTVEELLASMTAGQLVEPRAGKRAPSWLRALVVRGLARDPAERFPSMAALLEELGRERGWRRWRTPAVAVAVALIAFTVAKALAGGERPAVSCDTGAAEITASWSASQRQAVSRAFATIGSTYATSASAAVLAGLDDFRARWAGAHRAACVDHRDGSQSDLVLDRRMTCLRRRKDALVAAVDVLSQLDVGTVGHARELIARLPPVSDCSDLDLLAAEVEPAPTLQAREQVAKLEAELARVVAIERLGRSAEALQEVRLLKPRVKRVEVPALLIELLLVEGRILLFRNRYAEAKVPLEEAQALGLEHGRIAQAVVAGARRLYVESMDGVDLNGLVRQAELLEPMSRHLRDGFARPLLLNNVGVLHMAMEHREPAHRAFLQARRALGDRQPDLELTSIDHNLAMLTSDPAMRQQLARAVWQLRRQQLGEEHPWTLEALLSYGKYLEDPAIALPYLDQACELYRTTHPDLLAPHAQCVSLRGFLLGELGQTAAAIAAYEEAVEIAGRDSGLSASIRRQLAAGAAQLQRGALAQARQIFATLPTAAATAPWWARAQAAQAELGLGLAWATFSDLRIPIAHLERAIESYQEISKLNELAEAKQRLALARITLAMLWQKTGAAPARIAEQRALAAAFYRAAAPSTYHGRLAELDSAPGGDARRPSDQ